jgi:hypothetical protein
MDASELRARAAKRPTSWAPKRVELGPEPIGPEVELWREECRGAVVLLAGPADDDAELL